jgi:hypothetical protein
MDRMRRPESRIVLMSVVLVGVGSFAGAFLDRLSFPHMAQIFNTCASSEQFLVEFRTDEKRASQAIPGLIWDLLGRAATIEVDGVKIGEVGGYFPLRRFVCEGNHTAKIRYTEFEDHTAEHKLDFAVSRPTLFYVTKRWLSGDDKSPSCVSEQPCRWDIAFELSAYEPDDPKARIYPEQATR